MKKSLFFLSILLPFICSAQVVFEARVDSMVLLIGQQRELTLDVTCGASQKLQMPDYRPQQPLAEDVEIVELLGTDTTFIDDGKRMQVLQRYAITAWDSTIVLLPPFEVKVDGKPYQSKQLALKVFTVDVDTVHVDQFFPPKDIQRNPFSWDDWKPVFWFVGINQLLALVLLWLYSHWRQNKPLIQIIRRKRKLPAHQVAMNEIERIKSERKWAEEDSKEYYTQLTDTLRNYIRERYGFNAMEMTSSEIIERLMQEQDETALAELRQLFQTADLVKFAKYTTMINENDANLVSAIDFINQTKIEIDPNLPEEEIIIPEEVKQIKARSLTVKIMMGVIVTVAFVAICYAAYLAIDLIR
ncbi:MAG: hypothetical protein K6G70_09380 [Bacteroidaceae bacterium]|nr:hypothetical protein [Bacteroidaceae bacterium]